MQHSHSNWPFTVWQILQRAGVVLQLLGLIVSARLVWALCHVLPGALPTFMYLIFRIVQLWDRLQSLNPKHHSKS